MKAVVVDTNIGIVANKQSSHASLSCVQHCIDRLRQVKEEEMVVLDDGFAILREYLSRLMPVGQPREGSAFLNWIFDDKKNQERCEFVSITAKPGPEDDFAEFPDDPSLVGFDRSDRKFVAVALASKRTPTVLNAVDTDWRDYETSLSRFGVRIEFLCPDMMDA